jgi:hypothetical protein
MCTHSDKNKERCIDIMEGGCMKVHTFNKGVKKKIKVCALRISFNNVYRFVVTVLRKA